MLSLLGTLLGFGTSIVPEILGYFKQRQANQQQLSELKLQELDVEAEITETKGLYEHDQSLDSGTFVNGLRGSVRPVLTYLFFVMFATVKGTLLFAAVQDPAVNFETAILMIWDGETQAIFSAIIAFWFGNRAMSKARARIDKNAR
mgnify:CR=1 FL=1